MGEDTHQDGSRRKLDYKKKKRKIKKKIHTHSEDNYQKNKTKLNRKIRKCTDAMK